jgi:protein-arginine kinase activator protein McsA
LEEQESGGGVSTSVTEPDVQFDTTALEHYSMDVLQKRLSEVLEAEEYESAAKIRDEIKRREQKS